MLTNDGSEISVQLAQSLQARGWKVVILSFPASVIVQKQLLPSTLPHVQLKEMSEPHLKLQLEAIAQTYGTIGAFIHLNPLNPSGETAKDILKQVFLMAKYLKRSLNEAAQQGRSWFVTVSHLDGSLGLGEKINFNPLNGGLFGLTKTLNQEWERVFCRAIDLNSDIEPQKAAELIFSELFDPNLLISEVGYCLKERKTLIRDVDSAPNSVNRDDFLISQDALFLVSGGARGITAECAIELAKTAQCKFILFGRSVLDREPEYAIACTDEIQLKQCIIQALIQQGEKPTPLQVEKIFRQILNSREIKATLSRIRQAGGTADYIAIDITDKHSLQEKVSQIQQQWGQITGIIHGAGTLADKLIEHKTEQDFETVYKPKVQGLESLLSCVNSDQLKHLILFSSVAGFYGNVGQADYAIANEILNKFAHSFQKHHPDCRVISFNWSAWDGGMVTPALKQILAERNVEVIPISVGTQIFVEQLTQAHHNTPQIIVGSPLKQPAISLTTSLETHHIHCQLSQAANPFLQDHAIGENPVLPMTCAAAWMSNTCEGLYPGYRFFSYENLQNLKGITFDNTSAITYTLKVEEVSKSPNKFIKLNVVVSSQTELGQPRYHYKGTIELLTQIPPTSIYSSFDSHPDETLKNFDPYQNGTLFHGLIFQGVKKVLNISPQKVTLECIACSVSEHQQGQIPAQAFNPYLADVQMQSILIWLRHFYQMAGLPSSTEKGEQFQEITTGETFYVSMELQAYNQTKMVAHVIAHDRQGKIYSQVLNVNLIISERMTHLFLQSKQQKIRNITAFFQKSLELHAHSIGEALYEGLFEKFVGRVFLEDASNFDSLKGQPVLYLANHQVAVESFLSMFVISAMSGNIINAIAKIEHQQQSWMAQFMSQIYSYPKLKDPELVFFFDRKNQLSMLQLLGSIKKAILEKGRSLLIHTQGTRFLNCQEPVTNLSSVFIDLALDLNLPIIPIYFAGGLPTESLPKRLEFPVGYTYQNYHLGKAIYPETFRKLPNIERKTLILNQLNRLGKTSETGPNPCNTEFEQSVKYVMKSMNFSEEKAALYQILAATKNPSEEICLLLAGIKQSFLKIPNTPEGHWLGKFGQWLSDGKLAVNIQ